MARLVRSDRGANYAAALLDDGVTVVIGKSNIEKHSEIWILDDAKRHGHREHGRDRQRVLGGQARVRDGEEHLRAARGPQRHL